MTCRFPPCFAIWWKRAANGQGRAIVAATALTALALAGLAVFESAEQRIAIIVVVATIIGFIALRLVALGVMALARRAPQAQAASNGAWRSLIFIAPAR